jgi:hypothetical protein
MSLLIPIKFFQVLSLSPKGQHPLILKMYLLCVAISAVAAKPNVLFIVADDQGYANIGYHNSTTKTPRIDELARDGVILEGLVFDFFDFLAYRSRGPTSYQRSSNGSPPSGLTGSSQSHALADARRHLLSCSWLTRATRWFDAGTMCNRYVRQHAQAL